MVNSFLVFPLIETLGSSYNDSGDLSESLKQRVSSSYRMLIHSLAAQPLTAQSSNDVPSCLSATLTVTNAINPNHLAGPGLNLAAWHGTEELTGGSDVFCWRRPVGAGLLEQSAKLLGSGGPFFVSAPWPNTAPLLLLLISTRLAGLWDWGCAWASPAGLTNGSRSPSLYNASI